ncbi:MAG TPA: DUF4184 family protein [Flavisolibacter sp.]|nr:DUF4184 family protein [Flavisolibacter sp.]
MPFTFSHPAIVLPLNRVKGLSITGLITGSIAPDFEYFIRMADKRVYTHTWTGLLWFDTPLALLLAFLFHNVVRNQLIYNAPINFQRRLMRYEYFNWTLYFKKRWLIITVSVIIGIISHLFWDGFTHENGFFVSYLPFLSTTILIGSFSIEGHMMLQLLSSIIGGLVILYALWQLPKDQRTTVNNHYLSFWKKVSLVTIIVFFIRLLMGVSFEIEDLIIPAVSAFLIALLLISVLRKGLYN